MDLWTRAEAAEEGGRQVRQPGFTAHTVTHTTAPLPEVTEGLQANSEAPIKNKRPSIHK